ncbi:MAG: hypothetical protein HKP61_06995, partial [Dactylosporangium sp.]|nr:hypothetical protein [Dactylosporangium sp.]NNJ60692.1 hypothetical protein [Dactylosporangium sp.]
ATVWAAAALPMGLLAWVVAPWLADRLDAPSQLPKALTKRYRSALIGIAVHSAQSVVFLALALALVLGHGTR